MRIFDTHLRSDSGSAVSKPIWGDGFSGDGWRELLQVSDWNFVSTDEYARYFPRLPNPDRGVLAWAETTATKRLRRRSRSQRGVEHSPENDVGRCIQASRDKQVPAYDEDIAANFAYLTSLHPAYLWPSALCSHGLFTALAWFGHLSDGRKAFMTADLAEYFLDVLPRQNRGIRIAEPRLWPIVTPAIASKIVCAAEARCTGRNVAIAFRTDTPFPASKRKPFFRYGLFRDLFVQQKLPTDDGVVL